MERNPLKNKISICFNTNHMDAACLCFVNVSALLCKCVRKVDLPPVR